MAKVLYSLLLSDEIVAAVDILAAREGCSRSALINHILAEYTSLTTPEKRRKEILQEVETSIDMLSSISSGGTLTLRTALRYKYNPAVFYLVELQETEENMGELRVGLRTQNQNLLQNLQSFFKLWTLLEQQHLPVAPHKTLHSQSERRYVRALRHPDVQGRRQAGRAIAAYVQLFDTCLKTFFDYPQDLAAAAQAAEAQYLQALPGMGAALEL